MTGERRRHDAPDAASDPVQPSGQAAEAPGPAEAAGTADASEVLEAAEAVEEDLAAAVQSARRERDEYLDMLRRVQADFENYKKRMLRQQTELLERAAEGLVLRLLTVLDAFELARAHLEAEASPESKALLQAAGLLSDTLAKEGLERFDDQGGPFDPTHHEAVEHQPAPPEAAVVAGAGAGDEGGAEGEGAGGAGAEDTAAGAPGPVVSEVLRPGYRYKGRVIRPAMVKVRG